MVCAILMKPATRKVFETIRFLQQSKKETTQPVISNESGYSTRQVRRAIRDLETLGLLETICKGNRGNEYVIRY